jgi:V/A-type H+-transporting ATPase subunit K
MIVIVAVLVGMVPLVPAIIYFLREREFQLSKATRGLVMGLHGFNAVVGLMVAGAGLVWLASPATAIAAGLVPATAAADPYAGLAAAFSTGLACIGAGVAVGGTGAAAIGAIAEKPEAFGRSLIFVGMAEGIAIYGLVISFLVLNR